MLKQVIFGKKGQQLVGILHLPERLGKVPGIAMLHGFTGNKVEDHRFFVHVARNLCDSGFAVLRFDFGGSGDSDGEFSDMTVPSEVEDAEKALTFLAGQKRVDKEMLGVIGLSMGGRVAAILASRDKRVKFVVLYSAALSSLRGKFTSQIGKEGLQKLNNNRAAKVSNGWYLKKPFFETIDDIVPLDVMKEIKAPCLIIHSDTDQIVPVSDAEKGYEIVRNSNNKTEICVIKGGDHTFSEKEHETAAINKTRTWLCSLFPMK